MEEIENKHKDVIDIAKKYMNSIKDPEHNEKHMIDVVNYTKELLGLIKENVDREVCIISAYWHDVGRIKLADGHERLSAEMLRDELTERNYDKDFIVKCYKAIEKHKWNMAPETIEGRIVSDADKLAWLGKGRWEACLKSRQGLDDIIELMPRLKDEILYFNESKKIYDREIVNLVKILHQKIYE